MLEITPNGAGAGVEAAAGREDQRAVGELGCAGHDVEIGGGSPVLGPWQGESNIDWQGRGPEFTGRSARGWLCWWASVRACLEEAVGAWWSRTKVKRRKAFLGWASWPRAAMPGTCCWAEGVVATRSRRNLSVLPREVCWVPLFGRPEDERTMADGPAEVGGSRTTGRRG
jgi:hypothetical protein